MLRLRFNVCFLLLQVNCYLKICIGILCIKCSFYLIEIWGCFLVLEFHVVVLCGMVVEKIFFVVYL